MQEHVVSLNSREKQIAREKVALSRERLSLHNERKQVEGRQQCSLCRSQNVPTYNFEQNYTLPETFLNVPVSRDYGNANMSSAVNAIEQEMAHLMGRSLTLRHSAEISNVTSHDERYMGDRMMGEEFQATHVESGAFKVSDIF